jgi:hypothetical protein
MRLGTWIGIGLFAIAAVGCGGGGGKPGSYSEISAAFAHPSGTLDMTNADAVAMAYQSSRTTGATSPAGGRRLQPTASAVSQSTACPVSGNISYTIDQATAQNVSESWSYNNCCETADCCLNGGGTYYASLQGASLGAYCESFNVTETCGSLPMPVTENFSTCTDGTTGTVSYLITVLGKTFVVSGSYTNGNGTLTITDMNGKFTCSYTNDHGTCSGGVGVTFTF